MSNRYTIGVKAKFAGDATVIKYKGVCYYRLYKQGNTTTVPSSACIRFYSIDPCTSNPSLTGAPLSCYNCTKGEYEFRPNTVFEVPDVDDTVQFRFVPVKHMDYGMFKFLVGSKFFTKNLQLSGNHIIFDPNGPDEHAFASDVHPYTINFSKDGNNYCLKYAGKGSYIFVMSIDSADTALSTIPNSGIGNVPSTGTGNFPTPTPTVPDVIGPDGPDGITFHRSVSWPSSGTPILSMWYDAAQPVTIERIPTEPSKVLVWKDRSDHSRDLISPQYDSFVDSATNIRNPSYLSGGGIGGGPSLVFGVDGTNGGRYLVLDESSMDHRATFIVASYEGKVVNGSQRGKGQQGLVTGRTNAGGPEAANGNMFVIPHKYANWNVIGIGKASIYSDKGSNNTDAGQYYLCGKPHADNAIVIQQSYMRGVLYEGIRTTGTSPKVDGLCVGSELMLEYGPNRGWTGKIAEIIILDDEPSTQLRQEIEGYLTWKWGLVECIPAGHPWKSGPPVEIPPTPTPIPPPTPTPTEPAPPLPRGVPVGVNLVTTTQLIDVVSQRNYPATLWAGGHYENDWELINQRLDVLSNTSLKQALTGSIAETMNVMVSGAPDLKKPWRSTLYSQDDIDCGEVKDVIRLGFPESVIDDADNRILYCLNRIQVSDSVNYGKTLYQATKDVSIPGNPDPIAYPSVWDLFIKSVRNVDSGYGADTTRYTGGSYDIDLKLLEKTAQLPLLIETPGFSYNIIEDLQIPLTTLYYVPGTANSSPINNDIEPLFLSDVTSRVDVALELMHHPGTNLLWSKPISIGTEATLEITADLPGVSDDRQSYTNVTGNLPWKVDIEIVDKSDDTAVYKSIKPNFPSAIPTHIPTTSASVIISNIAGRDYKITPYFADYRSTSTDQIVQQGPTGPYPVIFLRIDRV